MEDKPKNKIVEPKKEEPDEFIMGILGNEGSNEGNKTSEKKEGNSEEDHYNKLKEEDDKEQIQYIINDKSKDDPIQELIEGTPYFAFVSAIIFGCFMLFEKRKKDCSDDIICLYSQQPVFKIINCHGKKQEKMNNLKKKKIDIEREKKEDDIKNVRKFSNDMIRKKILGKFLKEILLRFQKLYPEENDKIKKLFKFDKKYKENISIREYKKIFNYTLEEFLGENCYDKYKENFNELKLNTSIFSRKMKDLYKEYLDSQQFEESIMKLKEEGELFDYIHQYINIANNIINYYEESKCREEKNKIAKDK